MKICIKAMYLNFVLFISYEKLFQHLYENLERKFILFGNTKSDKEK